MTGQPAFFLAPLLERLRPLLAAEKDPVYVVGGTVRDALLEHASHDIDLIVADSAVPLTFRVAKALGLPAFILDNERDVGRIIAPDDELTVDIARFRGPTLADDLHGRDFTVNALALPITAQTIDEIIDLHEGLADLRQGLIRMVHPHSIGEDPVRALRAVRFTTQLGFTMTEATAAAARAVAPILAERISAERIRDELSRILATGAPHLGISRLKELGLLPVVLPDVAALDGLTQSPPHHEDVFRHTLSVLRYLAQIESLVDGVAIEDNWGAAVDELLGPYRDDLRAHLERTTDGGVKGRLLLRWGALFHDVGKSKTRTVDPDGRIRFLEHDTIGAEVTGRVLSAFCFSNEAIRRVRAIVAGHMRPLHLAAEKRPPSRRTVYRYFRTLHEAGIDVSLLTLADHLATHDGMGDLAGWDSLLVVVRSLLETYFNHHEETVAPPRLLDGAAIMSLLAMPPGHEVGRLLRLLEEAQAAGEVNSREEAIAFIREHHSA